MTTEQTGAQAGQRDCRTGYACGNTCISKQKVCLKKLGSNRALATIQRLKDNIERQVVTKSKKSQPDLITDI